MSDTSTDELEAGATELKAGAAESKAGTVELEAGTVEYTERGEGPPLVFSHGLMVGPDIWGQLVDRLSERGYRCIRPVLPTGSHRLAMRPEADLSPTGCAEVLGDFIDAMRLESPTVIGNDSGGAIAQILASNRPELFGRLILTNCDIAEAFPPFPYSLLPPLARLPRGIDLLAASLRLPAVRALVFRPIVSRPIPAATLRAWVTPALEDDRIRDDVRKLIAGTYPRLTIEAGRKLAQFNRPTLFAWGAEDRFFKPSMAAALAETMPDARIELIANARTFVMLDRPDRLAEAIAAFVPNSPPA